MRNVISDRPDPRASARRYYTWTGEVTVSVNFVKNWYVVSDSLSLTGDPAANLPAGGGILSDNDEIIGEVSLSQFSYTDVELGVVAEPLLPLVDLQIFWCDTLSGPVWSKPVVYITIPEPTSLALFAIGLGGISAIWRRKRT